MQVTFEKIKKRYGTFHAVKDLNLAIESGALHFLLGPSGCGKTTTLRMLAGLEQPTEGRIQFDGRDVTRLPAAERGVGMVFQNYALWPHMTVRKNVEYGLKLRKLSAREINDRVEKVLDFTQLTHFVERLPGQLSGGQQQRVALARALAIRPNVLLLDEPLSNLDAKLRLEMRDNICRIHRETGITTIYVTHDQKEALSMGTHVSVMRAGHLIQTAPPRILYHHPVTPFIAGFIGETNLIDGKIIKTLGNEVMVDTPLGLLKASHLKNPPDSGEVTVSIRPEAIAAHLAGPSEGNEPEFGENGFDVILDRLTYLGESEQLQLHTKSGLTLKATVFNAPEHSRKAGDHLRCHVRSHDILILPRQSDMSSGT